MPVRTGSNSRLQAAWSASPTVWTIAGWFRLNSAGGMMMFRSKAAAVGSTGVFAESNGTTLTNYTQTSSGGTSDQISGDQNLYNTGAALVPLMMTRNGNVVTLFDPNNTSGRSLNISVAGATMADVAAADTLAFGAWVQQGTVTLPIDQDCDELSAWALAASATEYAAFASATKPEDIGDTTFKASMFDVWTLNPGGAGGTAIADGTTFTGLKNSNVLTLIGTTATVSSRAAPVTRTPPLTATLNGSLDTITGAVVVGPAAISADLNGSLDTITGNLAAGGSTGRLTSQLPLRDAARVMLANRSDVAVHVMAKPGLGSVVVLSAQSIASGIWTAAGPFTPGQRYNVMYEVGGEPIGCEIITATAP